jgi:hypothetical protein
MGTILDFEVGKTYRTLLNRTAQVCNWHGPRMAQPYRIFVLGDAAWANHSGVFCTGDNLNKCADVMLPGAIEDQPMHAAPPRACAGETLMPPLPQRKPPPTVPADPTLKCTVCGLRWPETEECRTPRDCNLVREAE